NCHTINLPVMDKATSGHSLEQVTYLEWLNHRLICDLSVTRLCEEHPEDGPQDDRDACATCRRAPWRSEGPRLPGRRFTPRCDDREHGHCRSPQNVKETFAAKALKPLAPLTSWCRYSTLRAANWAKSKRSPPSDNVWRSAGASAIGMRRSVYSTRA